MAVPKLVIWMFCGIGAGQLGAAAFLYQDRHEFVRHTEQADGTVIDLLPSRSERGGKVSISYSPVIEFRTATGQTIEFRSSIGSSPPSYREGEKVAVLYRPDSPYQAEIDDFFFLWGGVAILGGVGTAFSALGAALALADRRQRPR